MSDSHRIYYINTLFKTSGTNENFQFHFQIPSAEHYDSVVVLSASIPNSFYLIQDGFNTFTIDEDGQLVKIIIPAGNYSAKVFGLVVQALMTAASPHGLSYTMKMPNQNIEASTGKFTYSVSGENAFQPAIICTDHVNEQLGFPVFSTNRFVGNQIISATTVNFGAESTLFIHSDIANSGDSDVLQEIYAGNTQTLSYITYQCTTPELYSKVLQTNQSNSFNFSLTNEKKQLMNLNGVDMQLTVCLFKKDNISELIRKYIQYKVHSESEPAE